MKFGELFKDMYDMSAEYAHRHVEILLTYPIEISIMFIAIAVAFIGFVWQSGRGK